MPAASNMTATRGPGFSAHMDYVAETLPVAFLNQPAESNVWGTPLTKNMDEIPGLAIAFTLLDHGVDAIAHFGGSGIGEDAAIAERGDHIPCGRDPMR